MARSDQQKRHKQMKKAAQVSLLSVANNQKSNPKNIIEVKDKWVKVGDRVQDMSCLKACSHV